MAGGYCAGLAKILVFGGWERCFCLWDTAGWLGGWVAAYLALLLLILREGERERGRERGREEYDVLVLGWGDVQVYGCVDVWMWGDRIVMVSLYRWRWKGGKGKR